MPAHTEPASPRPDVGHASTSGEVVTLRCAITDAEAMTDLAWTLGATGVAELTDDEPDVVRLVVGTDDPAAGARLLAGLAGDPRTLEATARCQSTISGSTPGAHGATPQRAGPFAIRLSDHEPVDAPVAMVIEPGPTFGYGHRSTLLALELIATRPPPARHRAGPRHR